MLIYIKVNNTYSVTLIVKVCYNIIILRNAYTVNP
jgi:hypothetical protein